MTVRRRGQRQHPLLVAALVAAERGSYVFPVVPGGKTPALKRWQQRATHDIRQIWRWWHSNINWNIGIATGQSGLVVIDLDQGHGENPPDRFVGARNGSDTLAMLAAEAGAEIPVDTYTVATPSGGTHLYFHQPEGVQLRCTTGTVGWRIDTRGHGGYIVAAGSRRAEGMYRVVRDGPVADLPDWLVRALTPAPLPEPAPSMRLTGIRASAYVDAIVRGEAHDVASASVGTRHNTLLRAARTLGRLVGGGELAEAHAWTALTDAASMHLGVADWSAAEIRQTIDDGLAYGKRLPRRITADRTMTSASRAFVLQGRRRPHSLSSQPSPGL